MVIDERECRKETVAEVARQIMIAGRTAPKGKGIGLLCQYSFDCYRCKASRF